MRRLALGRFVVTPLLLLTFFDAGAESNHSFKGNVGLQYRSNSNINLAPFSGGGFDFADADDFGSDDDDDLGFEDDEDLTDEVDLGFDEDELEEDDAVDEDGDGIDDAIDADDGVAGGAAPAKSNNKERRATLKLGLNHRYRLSKSHSWVNSLKIGNDHHESQDELDKINYSVSTGWEFVPRNSPHKFKPSISYVSLEKDDQRFAETIVASLSYQLKATDFIALTATYNYQDKDISNVRSPDARILTFSLGAEIDVTDNDILKLKIAPKVEDSTVTTRNTDAYGYDITYSRKLPWQMVLGLGYSYDAVEYRQIQPSRSDKTDVYAVELNKNFGKHYVVGAGYEAKDRRSNIPSKESENNSAYVEVSWKF